jgi:hypothetical protein
MGDNNLVKIMEVQFNLAFSMISEFLEKCPDEIWNKKLGGHIFWQQLLHTYTGTNFWFRIKKEKFIEPFQGKEVYPEFEDDPKDFISKGEMENFVSLVTQEAIVFFKDKSNSWLSEPNVIYNKITNLDVINMQIRHIMYHVGYCNCILHEEGVPAVEWKDYFGSK